MRLLGQKILILDDVLHEDECNALIKFYKEIGPKKQHRDTFVLPLQSDMIINRTVANIVSAFNNFSTSKINISWCEIVEWPEKSFHPAHIDDTDRSISFTSITYLNNSYTGGNTFFVDDIEVVPKVGRTIYFDGMFYRHGVTQVENGVRYTLPIWYK
jgi:hypothetical protein